MKELYKKLLAVQQEVGAISKDSKNPYFKSMYFDINGLLSELKPLLNKHGLVVLQPLTNLGPNDRPGIETTVIDPVSGERLAYITRLPENPDPQKMGSAITYFRRYSLQSLFLLQAQDDDGNTASGRYDHVIQAASQGVPVQVEEYEGAVEAGLGTQINEAKKEYKRSPQYKKGLVYRDPAKQKEHELKYQDVSTIE